MSKGSEILYDHHEYDENVYHKEEVLIAMKEMAWMVWKVGKRATAENWDFIRIEFEQWYERPIKGEWQ